jgi:hypothetical protein
MVQAEEFPGKREARAVFRSGTSIRPNTAMLVALAGRKGWPHTSLSDSSRSRSLGAMIEAMTTLLPSRALPDENRAASCGSGLPLVGRHEAARTRTRCSHSNAPEHSAKAGWGRGHSRPSIRAPQRWPPSRRGNSRRHRPLGASPRPTGRSGPQREARERSGVEGRNTALGFRNRLPKGLDHIAPVLRAGPVPQVTRSSGVA